MRFGMVLLLPFWALNTLGGSTGCTGGCFEEADPVRVIPVTSCLNLEVGTICGNAELEGSNACTDALVLPAPSPDAEAVRVEPGASIRYTMNRSSPGIRIIQGDDNTDWVISAMLGEQNITITVTVHDID